MGRPGKLALAAAILACGLGLDMPAAQAADTRPGPAVQAGSANAVLIVQDKAGKRHAFTLAELKAMPSHHLRLTYLAEHNKPHHATFDGPLLWTVLKAAGLVGEAPKDQSNHVIRLTARDGFNAMLGLGEIGPTLEHKAVIVALRMDGKPLDMANIRLAVPGDKHGSRDVRELTQITVE